MPPEETGAVLAAEAEPFAGFGCSAPGGVGRVPVPATPSRFTPSGHGDEGARVRSVIPRMVVADVEAEVRFLRAVFDATGDVHPGRPAEVQIGDSEVLVSPAGERDPFPAFLYVYVDDADRTYRRALDAGADSVEAPFDTPYGDRRGMVRDAFGNVFQIATPKR
jgi:uncharacterized glyoxalase superfamily protein PhnB